MGRGRVDGVSEARGPSALFEDKTRVHVNQQRSALHGEALFRASLPEWAILASAFSGIHWPSLVKAMPPVAVAVWCCEASSQVRSFYNHLRLRQMLRLYLHDGSSSRSESRWGSVAEEPGRLGSSVAQTSCVFSKTQTRVASTPFYGEESSDSPSLATCVICCEAESVGDRFKILACGHSFHLGCLHAWLVASPTLACPLYVRGGPEWGEGKRVSAWHGSGGTR